jgi:hypothetical protein
VYVGVTGEVLAALETLAGEDVTGLPDAVLRDELLDLLLAVNRLQAQLARRVMHFQTRGLSREDGCRSTKTWLRAFGQVSPSAAKALVGRGDLLARLPDLAAVAVAGQVSAEHVDKLVRLSERVGFDVVEGCAPALARAAAELDPLEFQRVCDRVRAHADPDGPEPDAGKDFARRGLTVGSFDGMVVFRGQLDPEGGAALLSALDAFLCPPAGDDPRTPDQRRADALVEVCRRVLSGGGAAPTVGGMRPQVGVLLRPENLVPRAGDGVGPEPATMEWVGEIPDSLAQRIACDSDVWRVLLDPATGRPVDVGRAHRIVPHWIRKALWARDGSCRFPGCHAPVAWCDAHHLIAWAAGGATDLGNLVLLCRFHHGLIHEGGWKLRYDPTANTVVAIRPNGQLYEIRGKPSTMDDVA